MLKRFYAFLLKCRVPRPIVFGLAYFLYYPSKLFDMKLVKLTINILLVIFVIGSWLYGVSDVIVNIAHAVIAKDMSDVTRWGVIIPHLFLALFLLALMAMFFAATEDDTSYDVRHNIVPPEEKDDER